MQILSAATAYQEQKKANIFAHENQTAITAKFADFQTKVCDKLVKNGVDIELFRLFVENQFPPGDCIPPPPASLIEIFRAITHHGLWNYLHYSPLVKIIEKFGAKDPEMEGWVETYEKDLKSFCLATKVEETDLGVADFPLEERAKYNLHYYCPVEWKTEFIDHSLQYVTEVWRVFSCRYLGPKSPLTALLDRVRKGCFSITWLVPSYLIPALTKRAKSDTNFFQQYRILKLTAADQCVYEKPVSPLALSRHPGHIIQSQGRSKESVIRHHPLHEFHCCNHHWRERKNPQSKCQKSGKIQAAIPKEEEECANLYALNAETTIL